MGVATVGLLHRVVRRTTGSAAPGLIAGAVMALTPVAVLMFRFNNPDALLTLLMVGAAAAHPARASSASESTPKRPPVRWLALGGALVGLAFLTKMLQAFLVLPALALAYLLFAQAPRGASASATCSSRSARCCSPAAGGSRSSSCGRPRAGPTSAARRTTRSSSSPSATTGFGRLTGNETGSVGGGGGGTAAASGARPGCSGSSTARSAARSPGCSRRRSSSAVAALWFAPAGDEPAARRAHPVADLAARHRR